MNARRLLSAFLPGLLAAQATLAQPADPALSGISAYDTAVLADGVDTGSVTVLLQRLQNGNLVPVSGHIVQLTVLSAPNPGVIIFNPATATTNMSGMATFTCRSPLTQAALIGVRDISQGNQLMNRTATVLFTNQGRIFVRATAGGADTGVNWTDALTSLQAALSLAAGAGTSGASQIWVAAATYTPGGAPLTTFALANNLAIYGGFTGTETNLTQRDPLANETILSGEIASPAISDNIAHVVTAMNVSSTAILDGFTVRDAFAGYGGSDSIGGGLNITGGAPSIANCKFVSNRAGQGGAGAVVTGSMASFQNCTFEANIVFATSGQTGFRGGGAWVRGNGQPQFVNCVFRVNQTTGEGGGLCIDGGVADVVSCAFLSNGTASFLNSFGGGIAVPAAASARITNCTLRANATGRDNRAGGLDISSGATVTLKNSILWQNTSAGAILPISQIFVLGSTLNITFTTVQNGTVFTNCNNDLDPLFEDTDGRLSPNSPMLDSATDAVGLPPLPTTDLDRNARIVNVPNRPLPGLCPSNADRGAYEYPTRRCVKAGNPSAATGTVWRNAFATLQSALDYVATADGTITQLWVAAGAYVPTARTIPSDPRSAVFTLRNGLTILGGYFGTPATDGSRNPLTNITTLTGDIAGPGINDNCYHVLLASGVGNTAVLDGFRIISAYANGSGSANLGGGIYALNGSPSISQCTFMSNNAVGGAGAYFLGGSPTLSSCSFTNNGGLPGQSGGALLANSATISLSGITFNGNTAAAGIAANGGLLTCQTTVTGTGIDVQTATFEIGPPDTDDLAPNTISGTGGVHVATGATLQFRSLSPSQPAIEVDTNITGTGQVALAEQSMVELDNATIDLSGLPIIAACRTPVGSFVLKGLLRVRNAAVQNCNITVHNDITTASCGKGVGGEIRVVDAAGRVRCNNIQSHADKYLRFAPGISPPAANVTPNTVAVDILYDGNPNAYGELYEYRAHDYTPTNTGFVQLPASPGYNTSEPWVLDELTVHENARLNLVDREADGAGRDVLYVRNLYLFPNCRLNIGLGTLYYQTLTLLASDGSTIPPINPPIPPNGRFVNGARGFDVPLMGYRLGVITMESDCEFSVRVTRDQAGGTNRVRRRDATDPAVLAAGLGTGGIMEMQTQTAVRVAARGSFARVYESEVVVLFRYLFRTDPSAAPWPANLGTRARMEVLLSSNPVVSGAPTKPVGTIYQPLPGRAGSIGSARWGVFMARVPRGTLDLEGGSFVEIQLHNPGSVLWIDDFDPLVDCSSGVCFDLDGWENVDGTDYLLALGAYGEPLDPFSSTVRLCLDKMSRDTYVDHADLQAGELQLHYGDGGCGLSLSGSGSGAGQTWPGGTRLLLAARPTGAATATSDQIYPLTSTGASAGPAFNPPSGTTPAGTYRGNGRMVRDSSGGVHQLHATQGLIRVRDATAIVPPQSAALNYAPLDLDVYVGPVTLGGGAVVGTAILDAAFDPRTSNATRYIYVAPVTVETADGFRYTPAARLERLGDGSVVVDRIYGTDPRLGSTTIVVNDSDTGDPLYTVYEPDYSHAREIEVDAAGNVYVLSAQGVGDNDWLLVYNNGGADPTLDDSSAAADITYAFNGVAGAPNVAGPSAMLRSYDDSIYLTSSVNTLPNRQARVYKYAISKLGTVVTGITYNSSIDFTFPDASTVDAPTQFSQIASLVQGNDSTIYVLGFAGPLYPNDVTFAANANTFTQTAWATIAGAPAVSWLATPNVALPFGAVWALCPADLDGNGLVDINDLTLLLSSFGLCQGAGGFRQAADLNGDGCVGINDLTILLSAFGSACP